MHTDPLQSPFREGLLRGRVALVTGGGTGIGQAIAEAYGALGARVALCGRRLDPVTAVAEGLVARGGEALAASVDIRDNDAVEAFVQRVKDTFGRVDILVNNAGGQFPSPAQLITPKGFEAVVRNNLLGTFNVTRAVANIAMVPQRFGVVINITANTLRGFPGMSHTGAARAGVDNLTKTLAVEWAPHHIRVNSIAPGTIRSTGTDRYPPELVALAEQKNPAKRLGAPAEVAHLAVFLASDAADYITGTTLYIDGGASLWGDLWQVE
ncbi:MAG: SDR family oxidoreductase [Deltaproteobacteria bacterium]|nr:SDR family oxidoreductase [Deltaproteobacteria bacterium]